MSISDPSADSATRPALRPDYSREQMEVWLRRHEALVKRASRGGIDVAFFGDSLIDGWMNQGRRFWDAYFEPLGAANFGIPGDRTQQVLWRVQHGELEGYVPRVVVLLIGTNNLDPGLGEPSRTTRNSPTEIIAGVSAIVRLVRSRFPETRILLNGLLPRGACNDSVRKEISAINSGIKQLEVHDPFLHFLDISSLLLRSDGSLGAAFKPDGLHLGEVGYQAWAEVLHPALVRLLKIHA